MPELPEVETIKNELAPRIAGRRFTAVVLSGAVSQPPARELGSRLVGQAIEGLRRRGKHLIFRLSNGEALFLHLRMSGLLLLKPKSAAPDAYTRAVFDLDDELELRFCDRRRLGTIRLEQDESQVVARLGPEPFDPAFTPEVMAEGLRRRTAPIKAVLCDQSFVAGIGNMYADEALFCARIHPLRRAKDLSSEEVRRLHQAIRTVLSSAITNRGASVDTYRDPAGEPGTAHFQFRVAHRGGKPCPACGTAIARIPIRNRGSYFCPRCQPC